MYIMSEQGVTHFIYTRTWWTVAILNDPLIKLGGSNGLVLLRERHVMVDLSMWSVCFHYTATHRSISPLCAFPLSISINNLNIPLGSPTFISYSVCTTPKTISYTFAHIYLTISSVVRHLVFILILIFNKTVLLSVCVSILRARTLRLQYRTGLSFNMTIDQTTRWIQPRYWRTTDTDVFCIQFPKQICDWSTNLDTSCVPPMCNQHQWSVSGPLIPFLIITRSLN
jgi:hypothetical protein